MASIGQGNRVDRFFNLTGALLHGLLICSLASPCFPRQAFAQQPAITKVKIGSTTYTGQKDNAFKFLLDHLALKLKREVDLVNYNDFMPILAALKSRQLEFAYVTPLDFLQAQRTIGAEALAIQLTPEGQPGYYSVLISRRLSGIKTLDQAKGKRLGFVAPESVTGFKIPVFCLLRERKQPIAALFAKTFFAGSHLKALEGLERGDFEVAATNNKDLQFSCQALGTKPADYNVIWKSDFIPESIFICRQDLPPELKASFAAALLSFKQDKKGLKALKIGGFAKINDSDFKLIRDLDAYLQKEKILY